MRDDRDPRHAMPITDVLDGPLDLQARTFGASQRHMVLRGLGHFRIRVRSAEAEEIAPPDVKARVGEFVTPGPTVEAVGDRESRRECRAMHVEDHLRRAGPAHGRWQIAQEKGEPLQLTGDPEMLLYRIQPCGGAIGRRTHY